MKKHKRFLSKKNKKAFTLIELLIVIAIIGILFIVLVSKVDFATDKAKATGVQTDFRSFQVALDQVAKENAGFNIFGWDTGDVNGDHIRNSYDRGDTNKNGKEDAGETFIGRKTYGEDWTTIYTMLNPDTTKPNDTSAFVALEQAINANLDPKLHITITPDVDGGNLTGNATITMANQARDPWKNEYHGVFITNAARDNGADRGAIIIYSNGANGKWGSAHDITNGVVSVTVPYNNKLGQDDMSIVSCYTYVNGYGEILNMTTGFSTNQGFLNGGSSNVGIGNDQSSIETMGSATFTDGVTLTWDELKLAENGVKYSYNANAITDSAIGDKAFDRCYGLLTIKLPEGIVSIGQEAFEWCDSMTEITIPDTVTTIGTYAFYDCHELKNIVIPASVTNLSPFAFKNGIEHIDVDENNPAYKSIDGVLYTKDGTVLLKYPSNRQDETFVVPDTVTTIYESAFVGCYYLKQINLSNVVNINNKAFYYSAKLETVIISDSLLKIGAEAFYSCSKLANIKYGGTEAQWQAITKSYNSFINAGTYTVTYNYNDN